MRRGGRILTVLGLVLGLITAGVTFVVLMGGTTTSQVGETQDVVVAAQPIPERSEIPISALTVQKLPVETVPKTGTFSKIEDFISEGSPYKNGMVAKFPIEPGQIILESMIISKDKNKDTRTYASLLVPDKKVAISFPISAQTGVAGAIQNGDTVDLLLTLAPAGVVVTSTTPARPGTTGTSSTTQDVQSVSQLFLQKVLVLQVGNWPIGGGGSTKEAAATAPIITFALDRQDALALKQAVELSTSSGIWLTLRPAGDQADYTTEGVSLNFLTKKYNYNFPVIPK